MTDTELIQREIEGMKEDELIEETLQELSMDMKKINRERREFLEWLVEE